MISYDTLKKQMEKAAKGKEKDVSKRYAKLYREIHGLLADRYSKYEKDGTLTYEELVKHNRLEKLMKEIHDKINKSDSSLSGDIKRHLKRQYKDSYYQSAFILESGSKAKIGFTKVKDEALDTAVNNEFKGLTLNERLSKRRNQLKYNMKEIITRGLVDGNSYKQMANAVKDELEGDLVKANRIVRTEAARIHEQANSDTAERARSKGVIMTKTWRTVDDERVRSSHEELDGVTIEVDEEFELEGYKAEAPLQFGIARLDINCRCYLSYDIEKVEKPQHEDLADLTFDEWQKERLK